MIQRQLFFILSLLPFLAGCVSYTTPARTTWSSHLQGVSFSDMTDVARQAKRPVYLGQGGKVIGADGVTAKLEYGDKVANDNVVVLNYMAHLEYELYDSLRKPGISVQRAGTDVVIILVRDALMQLNAAEFSDSGVDTLNIISKILNKYDASFVEIAGYTDAFADQKAAKALSLDMAQRAAVYMAQNKINTSRMFIVGRGSARPIAAQDDVGRLTNRRVEIRVAPAR